MRTPHQMYRHFKRQTSEISHEKTLKWHERNWISSDSCTKLRHKNYVKKQIKTKKTKTDKTQKKADVDYMMTDKTINHMLSEYSKLAQKEHKTRHD